MRTVKLTFSTAWYSSASGSSSLLLPLFASVFRAVSGVGAFIVWPLLFKVVSLSAFETCCAVDMFTVFAFVFAFVAVATAIVGTGIGSDEVVEAFAALMCTIVDTFISSDDDEVDDDDVDVNINDDAVVGEADVGNDAVIDFLCSFVACALEPVLGAEA